MLGKRRGGPVTMLWALGAAAILAGATTPAGAQLVFDGNILYQNNASGTLAGQGLGGSGAGAPSCAPALTTGALITTTYTHNQYVNPLLPTAPYQANVLPSFQPDLGSPAYNNAVTVPAGGFFDQTCYAGAIGPNSGDKWYEGWTYWDSSGAGRQDLHLVGMPDPRPLATYANVHVFGHRYWSPDSNYLVRGQLRIKSQGSLTIAPGVVVFEENATTGTIVVERGGRLNAIGSTCDPIIITSDDAPGSFATGHCGGIVINGYAKTNTVNSCAGDSAASEGGAVGFYGGNDDDWNAGCLRYVRVEFAGKEITPNNELNAFTWNACGKGTKGDYLQAYMGADDGFEWFGGTMDQKHLIAIDGRDDGYDWQLGTRNRAQYVIVRVSPLLAPSGTQQGDKGIEADNIASGSVICSGRSNSLVANATFIGDKRSGPSFPGVSAGVNWRVGTAGTLVNSIIFNFKTAGLRIDDDATWEAHCAAPPTLPTVFCPGALGVAPITSGRVFVAHGAPNPFRNRVQLSFELPRAEKVAVQIFAADGRLVETLHDGVMAAGPQSLAWNVGRDTPSGMYFYRVVAGSSQSTGKIAHVE